MKKERIPITRNRSRMPGTRPRIAVVCAYNPKNAGMYSVDLAAQHYFSGKGCAFDLFVTQIKRKLPGRIANRLRLDKILSKHQRFGTLRFRLLYNPNQFDDYTHVVYWGDFTTNPVYGATEYAMRERKGGVSASYSAALHKWKALFALQGGKPAGRVVSAGQNFQHDFNEYGSDFDDVFASIGACFDHILPRDPWSAANLLRTLPPSSACKVTPGLDCAFLLPVTERRSPRPQFCYHFGRSGFDRTAALVGAVEARSGLRGVALEDWFTLDPTRAEMQFTAMRAELAQARFVLTDTYHVSVNAMAMGVPVYGIGRHAASQTGTLGDFKKQTLFEMMQAQPCYFACAEDELEATFFQRVLAAVGAQEAMQPATADTVRETVSAHTAAFRTALDEAVFG
ncbi:MAG: polysaccharide pyruvyl transferase family protein [Roseovarius sp.]|nr:polysaccharide pyruvyl transferase family protein [Roseovarius sp.]